MKACQQKTSINIYYLIAILGLSLFPFWHYSNIAFPFLALSTTLYLFTSKQSGLHTLNWTDAGMALILLSCLVSLFTQAYACTCIPLASAYQIWVSVALIYFIFRCSKLPKPQTAFLFFSALLILSFHVIILASRHQFNYHQLTAVFSYQDGIGNISQIAMYASFALIAVFYTSTHKWMLATALLLVGILAFILSSKLLVLVALTLVLAKALAYQTFSLQLSIAFFLSIAGSILFFVYTPSSLAGRADLFITSWSNYDFSKIFGLGIGTYDVFINNVFFHQQASNTIGHVEHLAFNDFTQTVVELGLIGLLGLVLLLIGVSNKQNIFYVLALALVLFFMFPLQYLETAVLFIVVISLFQTTTTAFNYTFSYKNTKTRALILASTLTIYMSYSMYAYAQWATSDTKFEQTKNRNEAIKNYNQLGYYFIYDDSYLKNFGIHLLNQKRYNDALKVFQKANTINPSYESFIHIGDTYFQMNFYQEAIEQYHLAQLIRPKHLYPIYKELYALNNMGSTEVAEQKWALARNEFDKIKGTDMLIMKKELDDLFLQ